MAVSLKELVAKVLAFFSKHELDWEFDQELESHLAMLAAWTRLSPTWPPPAMNCQ
jgi:hypothetical protein